VLSVRTAQGVYILDNQNPRPVLHQQIAYYSPVSSFNANSRWVNIATRQIKTQYAKAIKNGSDPALAQKPVKITTVASGSAVAALPVPVLRPSFAAGELTVPESYMIPTRALLAHDEDRR
jgi:hypothetical protein